MTISINLNEAEAALVSKYAQEKKVSVSEFAHEAMMKAARNAEYLAKLDRADEQIKSGKYRIVSWEELENLVDE